MPDVSIENKTQPLPAEIYPTTLRDWLDEGQPVKVIDIRPANDYREWHIAGSENVVSYYQLQSGRPGELAEFDAQADVPIVAVCYAGNTSKAAAQYLRSRGLEATSLIGGMQWWSMAWNTATIPLTKSGDQVIQVRRSGKGCLSYVIASHGQAAVIDPSVDVQVYLDIVEEKGWEISKVIDTHVHADHLTRGKILAEQSGARYLLPTQDRVAFEYESINAGDTITIGNASLKAIHTPGHTFESVSIMLDEEALFTGDTLFLTSIGRPDLKASVDETKQRAHLLHKTLQKITNLPGETIILPSHTSKPVPFDYAPLTATLEEVKRNIEVLNMAEDDFIAFILTHIPQIPPNHLQIVEWNESGSFPEGDVSSLEAGANRCAIQ
jgi:glyoxylase-like metal-dependent hydrolase (beta-lactamase superfamily II)